jgi:cytochrome P450
MDRHLIGIVKGLFSLVPYPIPGNCLHKAYHSRDDLYALFRVMIQDFKAKNPQGVESSRNSMMGRLCYGLEGTKGDALTELQLLTNLHFILFAGYDTTKGSFCAFAHYLAEFPEMCEMLRKEVAEFSEPLDVDELIVECLFGRNLAHHGSLARASD